VNKREKEGGEWRRDIWRETERELVQGEEERES
jgi:hypothetical protein